MKIKSIVCIIVCCMLGTCLFGCQKSPDLIESWYMKAEFDREDLDEQKIRQAIEAIDKEAYLINWTEDLSRVCVLSNNKPALDMLQIDLFPTAEEAHQHYEKEANPWMMPTDYTSVYIRINQVVISGQGLFPKKFIQDLGIAVPQSYFVGTKEYQRISDDIALDSIIQYMTDNGYSVCGTSDGYFINSPYDEEKAMTSFMIEVPSKPEEIGKWHDDFAYSIFYNHEYMSYGIGNRWLTLLDEVEAWLEESAK